MATETGARDRRCRVQVAVYETEDESGGGAPRWDHVAYAWFSVQTLREFEVARNRAVEDESSHRLTCDYDPRLANLTETRILMEERTFKVLGVIDTDERHEELVYLCKEEIPRRANQ